MKTLGENLRLSQFDFCLDAYSCGAAFYGEPLYVAELSIVGQRNMTKIDDLDGDIYYADIITGSLYTEDGICMTSNKITAKNFQQTKEKIKKKHVAPMQQKNLASSELF